MIKPQTTQEAFNVIQQLAALCATPGITPDNVTTANDIMHDLLTKVIKPAVGNLTADAAGLIVK